MLKREYYSIAEVIELLKMAEDQGFSLEKGSPLEQLTINELDTLVNE